MVSPCGGQGVAPDARHLDCALGAAAQATGATEGAAAAQALQLLREYDAGFYHGTAAASTGVVPDDASDKRALGLVSYLALFAAGACVRVARRE